MNLKKEVIVKTATLKTYSWGSFFLMPGNVTKIIYPQINRNLLEDERNRNQTLLLCSEGQFLKLKENTERKPGQDISKGGLKVERRR